MALRQDRGDGVSISKLERIFGISRQSICRRIEYFGEHFSSSAKWQRIQGRISSKVTASELPRGLSRYFLDHCESMESGLVGCLRFLARGGAIPAFKLKRNWMVTEESLRKYIKAHET